MVKNSPLVQETWVRSLGGKDPLEKEMATHSSILAWKIPWTEGPGGWQSVGLKSWTWLSDQAHTCRVTLKDSGLPAQGTWCPKRGIWRPTEMCARTSSRDHWGRDWGDASSSQRTLHTTNPRKLQRGLGQVLGHGLWRNQPHHHCLDRPASRLWGYTLLLSVVLC